MSQPKLENLQPSQQFPPTDPTRIPPPPPLPPPMIFIHEIPPPENKFGNSATIFSLTQAIEEDSVQKMQTLIEVKDVNVDATLSYGVNILLKAVRSRSVKVVEYLITMGADPESSVCDMMRAPDGLEAEYGLLNRHDKWSVDILKRLLPMLGDRIHNIVDRVGRTLLYLSCYFPDLSLFEYLVNAGVDPNIRGEADSSVLHLLVSHNNYSWALKMMLLVLEVPHIQVNIPNHFGYTPLFLSILENKMEMFYALLQKGADPFVRTHANNTMMHWPFFRANKYLILYDLGLDVNAKNRAGLRPLEAKMELDFDFFVLLLLGREVLDAEYEKLESAFKADLVLQIKERVDRGEFSALRLKSLCRRTIRQQLFRVCPHTVAESVWQLPLPRPLQLYLDILSYAKSLLTAMNHE